MLDACLPGKEERVKLLGVDLGTSRTGLAVSEGAWLAVPAGVIVERDETQLTRRLADTARDYDATRIVVGYPRNMDGSIGPRAKACAEIAERLQLLSGIPVVLWDERRTTIAATDVLNQNNVRGRRRQEVIDTVAAVIILESYLRFLQSGGAQASPLEG